MRTLYLSILLAILFLPISMMGQRSFLDSGKLWKITNYIWSVEQTSELFSVNPNDTQTINGKTYFKFQDFWIREENQMVFFTKNNQDYPLYDFSLNVGDSFTSYSYHSLTPYLFRVDTKRKIKLKNGVDSIVYQEIKCLNNSKIRNIQLIEGIGAINSHPINAYMMFEAADIMYNVSCFLYKEEKVLEGLTNYQSCCLDEDILHPSNVWNIYESDDNGDTKYGSTIFPTNIDTFINNKTYRIVKFNKNNIYVRKDSNKYYQYLDSWSPENLLYKENAKVGDTIQNRNGFDPLVVDSVKIRLVNKNLLKYYYTKNDIIIGGIGNINNVFFQKRKYIHMEYRSGNVCFSRNTCNIFFNQYPESSSFKNCQLGIGILETDSKFDIYPNYTTDEVHIVRSDFAPVVISVYDLLGNCILTKTTRNSNEKLSLKNLQSGIYIIEIGNYKRKVVKE
jgi:hypothetical protein